MHQQYSVYFAFLAVCTLGILYSYFVYPIVLLVLRRKKVNESILPNTNQNPISLIITVHNEESSIGRKLDDSLLILNEIPDLEIIVASDGSTDKTDRIVSQYGHVSLVRTKARAGKENAQKCAIDAASGQILVFSDVATSIDAHSIHQIIQIFSDPAVGAVSSRDRLRSGDGTENAEGLYVRYEMWLRNLESDLGGLVGLSGSFFAARREVCANWDISIPSDFVVAINSKMLGYKSVSDDAVIGTYADIQQSHGEFTRKTRTIIRGMTALWKKREILNPARYGLFSFQMWSHKIMRWAVPWFAIAYSITAALLAIKSSTYFVFLLPVFITLVVGILAANVPVVRRNAIIRALYFFIMTNIAVLVASAQFLAGKRITMWSPTLRS